MKSKNKYNIMKQLPIWATLMIIALPLVVFSTYLGIREYRNQTVSALDRREAMANLGALLIHEKFDGIINVGNSFASRPLVYQNIEKGDYGAVVKNLQRIPQVLPDIDSIAILDKDGVMKAVVPPMPETIGKSFAYRDYYQEVSKEWKPYVSEAFKRTREPRYNVVSVAVPIYDSQEKDVLGVLLLTIKLDTITRWTKEVDVGQGSFIYIVDKNGHLVASPDLRSEDDLVDYSSLEVIKKILSGGHGVEVHDKDLVVDEKHLAAYSSISGYGFGLEVVQPTRIAFAKRTQQVIEYFLFWSLIILGVSFFSYRVLKDKENMRSQRDRERILLESIGDGIIAIDNEWRIILWNKAASLITGWSRDEVIGRPFRDIIRFIRERDHKDNVAFIESAIVEKKTSSMEDGTFLIRKDGSEVSVGDSAAPIVNANEEVQGAIIVFRDISDEIEKNHMRSDFVYSSHQLRTPVTEALWNLEIAIDEENANKRNEDLRIVYQSLSSIKKLSEDIVAVSEIDQGGMVAKISPIKFIDILSDVQNNVSKAVKERGITLTINPVSPIMAINTDKKLLSRLFFEIIENAISYSPRGSRVEVVTTLQEQEKKLLIEVIDKGVGIPEEEQVLIFTKFFRGSNRGKDVVGDGLGLYIAKAYMALLNGKMWFKSEEGKGTTFSILLPIE